MIAEAVATGPGANGLTFLPYLTGERTPHADSNARGAFSGLNVAHTRGHLTRAILEGVTFALRDSLELMRKLGVDATEVVAVGGGARSEAWRQMQADVLGVPVVRVGPSGGAPLRRGYSRSGGSGAFCVGTGGLRVVDPPDRPRRAAIRVGRTVRQGILSLPGTLPAPKAPLRRLVGVTSAFPDFQRRLDADPHGLFARARPQRGVADFVAALLVRRDGGHVPK